MPRILKALRPEHWPKNVLVMVAFFFALGDKEQAEVLQPLATSFLRSVAATGIFCLLSGAVYVMNDIRDLKLDRVHPVKKNRPIAAGAISLPQAWILALVLLTGGVVLCGLLSKELALVAGAYVVLQVAYSFFGLKKVAIVDVLLIAGGFVLRALAGAVVISVEISPWLILCTFLLALFLGFCKRRHERVLLESLTGENRPSLESYSEKVLDQIIAIVAACTVVCYALYTLSPETVLKFGSHQLGFTIPFVVFGIFRYLDLVYRHEKGHRPERILLTDAPIIIDVILYGLVVLYIVH